MERFLKENVLNALIITKNYQKKLPNSFHSLKLTEPNYFFKHNRILILAPHMDDEVIGAGASIGHLLKKGKKVKICYITSGLINNDLETQKKRFEESKRVFKNKVEREYLNYHESAINIRNLTEDLYKLFKEFKPDAIFYTKYCKNNHLNHNQLAIVCRILEGHYSCHYYGYEVEQPIRANLLIDFKKFNQKIKELKKYQTQLKVVDYIKFLQKAKKRNQHYYESFFEKRS